MRKESFINRPIMTGEITSELSMTTAVSPLRPEKPQTSNRSWAKSRVFFASTPWLCVARNKQGVQMGFLLMFDFTWLMVVQRVQSWQNSLS
jgi:hypothetical protein